MKKHYKYLKILKNDYENHHNVNYTPMRHLEACVEFNQIGICSDRHLPDKAIDALDEAGSRVHIT